MFDLMSIIVPIIFIIVIGIIVFSLGQGIVTWNKNNQSPRSTVSAVIIAKRENITHHQHANAGDASGAHGFHTTTNTMYYVTFQTESGDRMEFQVSRNRIWNVCRRRYRKIDFSRNEILSV